MNTLMEKLLNNVCLDERIDTGTFDITNNDHISIMREYLIHKGIDEIHALEFTNRVVEGGKHPQRQAYNANGILVTFPTPQHKQNAIRRGSHFEKDPTKGKPNLWGTGADGQPRKGPGRPPKDDKEKDTGEFTPPAEGGGQSITPTGDASSLPTSGTDTEQAPNADDTATTTTMAPEPAGASASAEPAQQGPPDVFPEKPPVEKEQDRKAIQKMMASKNTSLASPFNTEPIPVADDPQKDKADKTDLDVAKLYMKEALRAMERIMKY